MFDFTNEVKKGKILEKLQLGLTELGWAMPHSEKRKQKINNEKQKTKMKKEKWKMKNKK